MYYTNGSAITKTFHGITFRPGETKEVPGIINDPKFVPFSTRQEPPKRVEGTPSKSEGGESTKKSTRKRATKLVEDETKSEVETSKLTKDLEKSPTPDIDKQETKENKEV